MSSHLAAVALAPSSPTPSPLNDLPSPSLTTTLIDTAAAIETYIHEADRLLFGADARIKILEDRLCETESRLQARSTELLRAEQRHRHVLRFVRSIRRCHRSASHRETSQAIANTLAFLSQGIGAFVSGKE